jgi:hypothetical protein
MAAFRRGAVMATTGYSLRIAAMGPPTPANTVFGAEPSLCPILLDDLGQTVTALSLSRRDFEVVSFLDQRLLSQNYPRQAVSWTKIEDFDADRPEQLDYIFHIGHVGSTLLSRVLGQGPTVFSLREPAVLRRLAELHGQLGRHHVPGRRPSGSGESRG